MGANHHIPKASDWKIHEAAAKVSEHTPTPWAVGARAFLRVETSDGKTVATTGSDSDLRDQWEANAAFIVKAVNAHDALVEALEDLLSDVERQMKNPSHHVPFSYRKAKDLLASVGNAGGRS